MGYLYPEQKRRVSPIVSYVDMFTKKRLNKNLSDVFTFK